MRPTTTVMLAMATVFALGGATLAADEVTLTGTVGDAMCGVKHMMEDGKACTRGCVAKGSDFALIVDDTAYRLETSNDRTKATLQELAGKAAVITGDRTGETIMVASVDAAD